VYAVNVTTFLQHKFTSAMKVIINEYVSGQKLLLTQHHYWDIRYFGMLRGVDW